MVGPVGFEVNNRQLVPANVSRCPKRTLLTSRGDHFLRVAPDLQRIISVAEKVWDITVGPSLICSRSP